MTRTRPRGGGENHYIGTTTVIVSYRALYIPRSESGEIIQTAAHHASFLPLFSLGVMAML